MYRESPTICAALVIPKKKPHLILEKNPEKYLRSEKMHLGKNSGKILIEKQDPRRKITFSDYVVREARDGVRFSV